MIGFAVISWKDNGLNGFFAQGLGTSMLQVPNIVKNPLIWIPPTLASAITGPISTVLLKMQNLPAGSGMGTSGLVGPLLTYQAMIPNENGLSIILKMLVVYIIFYVLAVVLEKKQLKKSAIIVIFGFMNP